MRKTDDKSSSLSNQFHRNRNTFLHLLFAMHLSCNFLFAQNLHTDWAWLRERWESLQRIRASWLLIGGRQTVKASDWSAPGTPEAGGDASDAARPAPDTSLLFSAVYCAPGEAWDCRGVEQT